MKKFFSGISLVFLFITVAGQQNLTPETLWKLGRVSAVGITTDKTGVVYTVSTPDVAENKSVRKFYVVPIAGGAVREIPDTNKLVTDSRLSPDGKYLLSASDVKINKVAGKDFYPDLQK
jgi:hypothetical protein